MYGSKDVAETLFDIMHCFSPQKQYSVWSKKVVHYMTSPE